MQQHVDHPAVAEHRDGVLVVGAGDDVVDRRPDPAQERVLVDGAGQVAVDQPLQLGGVLRGDLLDRDVVREVAVVFGEPLVDLDRQPSASATGWAVWTARTCGLLTSAGYREAGQRVGQPRSLLDTLGGQVGIGALTGLAAQRQRMSDQKQLHRDTIWPVRAFACPVCRSFALFEAERCPDCSTRRGFPPAVQRDGRARR